MNKYIGKYRVCLEWDRNTLEPIKDDTYIQCSKDGQIYRVDKELLVYYRPRRGNSEQFSKKLIDLGVKRVKNCSTDSDILIQFAEENLDIVANEVGASTNGVDIKPWSIKNLRKQQWFKDNKQKYIDLGLYSELSEEEKAVLRERFNKNVNNK